MVIFISDATAMRMNYIEEEVTYKELHLEYQKLFKNNKALMDNMYYAAFVQQGILPQERHFKRLFNEYFIIYKPQHVIGGDLYWVAQKENWKILAVGDCTGHGMSGAMLSVLALSFLNYLVLGKDFASPGKILGELDRKWIETFSQGLELGYINNDWLEIGLCAFNAQTREIRFAGAFNKLICASADEVKVLNGNRFPIGGWQIEDKRIFTDHSYTLPEQSMLYMYSDGFKDQFGDISGKRFGSRRLDQLLESISKQPATRQMEKLEEEFNFWKGTEMQMDDVCVLGVRL
jgi:serine phosphatase RsbU (regulator of sigma subunit)